MEGERAVAVHLLNFGLREEEHSPRTTNRAAILEFNQITIMAPTPRIHNLIAQTLFAKF